MWSSQLAIHEHCGASYKQVKTQLTFHYKIKYHLQLCYTLEADWDPYEKGNQSTTIVFKKLLCNVPCLRSCMIKNKEWSLYILVLRCLGCIELNGVMIMTPKPTTKLRFSLDIMP